MSDKQFELIMQRLDKLDKIEATVHNIDKRLSNVEAEQKRTNERLDKIEYKLDQMQDAINVLDSDVKAIKNDISEIGKTQSRQFEILGELSLRSVEQESTLRKIKTAR